MPGAIHNHLARLERLTRPGGFTLTELMITSAIGSITLAAILTTYVFSLKSFQAISNYSEIHAAGRKAVDHFSRDIRAVNNIASFNAASYLRVTIPTNFAANGAITGVKTITYSYNNGALYRTDSSTGTTSMLATNIYQLSFTLYDKLGNPTSVPANAKGIQVDIRLRKFVISQIQSEDFLSARLDMRNTP
jgi:prepilin-type N-terminal cleavage/methylation domain-containing protein